VEAAPAPLVRVVVLNWNSAWLTARCVRSLRRSTYPADRMEIVVVDNASIDGSLPRLTTDLDGVRFVANPSNLGFAEGNNRALRDTGDAEFVALVNNDAVVDPGWLEPLVDALRSTPRAGAAAPKMLLETPFVSVPVNGRATIAAVEVDGVDVTRRCGYHDAVARAHPTIPLVVEHTVVGRATLDVPVAAAGPVTVTICWHPGPEARLSVDGEVVASSDHSITVAADGPRSVLLNGLGTELTPWAEGIERWFGEVDRPNLADHEVWGFSGGAVLLRTEMLRDVGLFDPKLFAYYEDTDLVWRSRRRGWSVVCTPSSVVHHLHGGSAGPEARGFFFLNYRNWLLTVLRNAPPRRILRALAVARRLSWPAFRRNVFGRVRRGQRPDARITLAWLRVGVGVAALAPRALWTRRRGARVGARPTDRTISRLMPDTPPRPPRRRPGGPLLCYVDVTETLRSGWRAGIQRVVCELVRHLPDADHDIELVAVCWSKVHGRFRRLDTAEYASLLAPTATQQPAGPGAAPGRVRRVAALVMHRSGAAPAVHAIRRRRELAAVPLAHRHLLLDDLEPGSVLLDLDASWNPTTAPRSELLERLRTRGIHTVALQYDLIPITHPEWFIPQLVDVFTAHVDAHLDAGSTFACISENTRAALVDHARRTGRAEPRATVVTLGAHREDLHDHACSTSTSADPYFLMVGTIEPRKNHAVVLDAFDRLHPDHPDLRLVVVGRAGWNNDAVLRRLETAGPQVEWRTSVTDTELDGLYRGARAVIVASITEGFGLPVVEALVRGTPVVSSRGGALPEAGGDHVEYFDAEAADQLGQLILRYATDHDHHRRRRAAAAAFRPTPWVATAAEVAAIVRQVGRDASAAAATR